MCLVFIHHKYNLKLDADKDIEHQECCTSPTKNLHGSLQGGKNYAFPEKIKKNAHDQSAESLPPYKF